MLRPDLSAELGIHNVTFSKGRRQAPIDAGPRPRLNNLGYSERGATDAASPARL